MVDVLDPKSHENVIDPACGSGGFLAASALYLKDNYSGNIFGVDKDAFLVKIARTYLTLVTNLEANIYCENSLEEITNWKSRTRNNISFEKFDVVLTNPPFGAKIPVVGSNLLAQYQLARVYDYEKDVSTLQLLDKQPPQVLFIERCMQLLKEGGRMGIVLPEGIFGNPSDKYIWRYLEKNAEIFGIVSLAQETFQPSTHTKTSVLFLRKGNKSKKSQIYMGIADKIGHNKNGKLIYKESAQGERILDDDIPEVTDHFRAFLKGKKFQLSRKSFILESNEISDMVYIPSYYDPEIRKELDELTRIGFELVSIGQLVEDKIIEIRRGNEIGSENYGTGPIPFVRTSDIVNWEIKVDPIKCVSEEVFLMYKENQDIQPGDILFVSDGTFLIGRSAMVGKDDSKMLIQSHVKKIRVIDKERLDPLYLFYLINSPIFKKQVSAKTFVQATISTLGSRIYEILLPISSDEEERKRISTKVKRIMQRKSDTRSLIRELTQEY
jgi:type I restriction enzyme M protein